MGTSPTILVSSSSAPTAVVAPSKFPVAPLLIAVASGILLASLGFGSIAYYLARSGKLALPVGAGKAETAVQPMSATTHDLVMEPLLVNLADGGGNSYLRIALTLRVADAADKKGTKPKGDKPKDGKDAGEDMTAVRDTMLTVLGQQMAEELLAANGKKQLKNSLKSAIAEHNPGLKVTDVFFTDFLVQR
jgi:flagellar protein FliL